MKSGLALILFAAALQAAEPSGPIRLDVDARDVPRKILHASLVIPAAPGPLTLLYPKWLPGEHGPT
ncbi:MAG TPA: M61 family peptidase, partial [Thermoanaerobaculia bacterium]